MPSPSNRNANATDALGIAPRTLVEVAATPAAQTEKKSGKTLPAKAGDFLGAFTPTSDRGVMLIGLRRGEKAVYWKQSTC